jgi:hypothetical protein
MEEHVRRLVAQLEEMGARISRLAQLLKIPLETSDQLDRALHHTTDGPALTGRQGQMRAELRGLLVLRYEVVTRLAGDVGSQATRDILLCAQDRLLCEGFAPQAPGMRLELLFDEI